MNTVKNKSLRIFLALCLLVQLVMPNMVWGSLGADVSTFQGTISISVTDTTFNVYQIFTINEVEADYSASGDLTNYKMTTNTDFYDFFDDSVAGLDSGDIPDTISAYAYSYLAAEWIYDNYDKASETPKLAALLKVYVENTDNSVNAIGTLTSTNPVSGLAYGYYLVVDTADSSNNYLVLLADTSTGKTVSLSPKTEVLDVTKQIYHNEVGQNTTENDIYGNEAGWGNVGDNQIGDTVYFRATAELPTAIAESYTEYYYTLIDFMDETLSYNNNLKIYSDSDYANEITGYSNLTPLPKDTDSNDAIFAVQFDKTQVQTLLDADKDTLYLKYSATLTDDAIIADGNQENTLHLLFSNSLTSQWNGDVPSSPDDYDDEEEFGHNKDTVYDYTFQVTIYKEDELGNKLKDVEFELKDSKEDKISVKDVTNAEGYGSYEGNVYVISEDGEATITTPDSGIVTILGLDDYDGSSNGTIYRLYETKPKDGYSLLTEYVEFYYEVDYDTNGDSIKSFTAFVSDDTKNYLEVTENTASEYSDGLGINMVSTGVADAEITIINNAGSLLPETGGVGTVMFYVVGIGMMAAAGVLIYKRKES